MEEPEQTPHATKGMEGMVTLEFDELPDDLLKQLLDAVRTPPHQREAAAQFVRYLFTRARYDHRFDVARSARKEADKQLEKLAKRAATFRAALDSLSEIAKMELGIRAYQLEVFGVAWDEEAQVLQRGDLLEQLDGEFHGRLRYQQFLKVIDEIAVAASGGVRHRARKDGAPPKLPGSPKSTALDALVYELWSRGGDHGFHLTFSPNTGTGTLIDFLRIAAPHLPENLVPRVLPLSRLYDLRAMARRF